MYKIHTERIAIATDQFLIPMPPSSTRSFHPSKYQLIPTRIQLYKFAYFPRTVVWWNSLPAAILTLPTVAAFRGAVTRAN